MNEYGILAIEGTARPKNNILDRLCKQDNNAGFQQDYMTKKRELSEVATIVQIFSLSDKMSQQAN